MAGVIQRKPGNSEICRTTEQPDDIAAKVSQDATTGLLVEVGICKVHITEATPISLLTKLVKAVNTANV